MGNASKLAAILSKKPEQIAQDGTGVRQFGATGAARPAAQVAGDDHELWESMSDLSALVREVATSVASRRCLRQLHAASLRRAQRSRRMCSPAAATRCERMTALSSAQRHRHLDVGLEPIHGLPTVKFVVGVELAAGQTAKLKRRCAD